MPPRPARPRSRGFALVIVLWSLGMLALLGTQLTATTRVQLRLATQARDQAEAEAAADGAAREAAFILLGGGRVGSPARPMRVRVGEVDVNILAEDEAAKINPNAVSKDVLRGLLVAIGVDQARAALLAGEIADWRTRSQDSVLGGLKIDQYRDHGLPYRSGDHPFYSVDEIGLIPDMTPEILARLRLWLSVYHEGGVSDPSGASPAAAAIGDAGMSHSGAAGPGFVSGNVVWRVTAAAVIPGRARFVRSAVVRLRGEATAADGDPVQILTWE
jgi:general secretion pathway protein K